LCVHDRDDPDLDPHLRRAEGRHPGLRPEGCSVTHPLSELLDHDPIVRIADGILAEVGYGKLSMDGVARRAHAGKAAIYRRWPAKQDMVLDAVASISLPVRETLSSGDLVSDVVDIVRSVDDWLGESRMSRIMPDLLAEAKRNRDLADALSARLGVTRREYGHAVLEEARRRGELGADVDVEYALDLMAAPIFWRICGRRQNTTPEFLDLVVDTVLHALGVQRPVQR
jgi:AcrR family transcriptional regulator